MSDKAPGISDGSPGSAPDGLPLRTYRMFMGRIRFLHVAVVCGLGLLGGIGLFTFIYGQGASYLSNNPATCINCHIMQGHYDAWMNSSHHQVAICNDCHLPHDPIGKWRVKGDNGFFHSLAFTTGRFHEPIQIKDRNRRVTQGACLHCHRDFVHYMLPTKPGGDMLLCVQCHKDVGHALRR